MFACTSCPGGLEEPGRTLCRGRCGAHGRQELARDEQGARAEGRCRHRETCGCPHFNALQDAVLPAQQEQAQTTRPGQASPAPSTAFTTPHSLQLLGCALLFSAQACNLICWWSVFCDWCRLCSLRSHHPSVADTCLYAQTLTASQRLTRSSCSLPALTGPLAACSRRTAASTAAQKHSQQLTPLPIPIWEVAQKLKSELWGLLPDILHCAHLQKVSTAMVIMSQETKGRPCIQLACEEFSQY